jgi:hypothetical protein
MAGDGPLAQAQQWLVRALGTGGAARCQLGKPGFALPELDGLRPVRLPGGNLLLRGGSSDALSIHVTPGGMENLVICEGFGHGALDMSIAGSGNVVILCRTSKFQGRIGVAGSDHLFFWGRGATCNDGNFVLGAGGKGTTVAFGEDCMLSQRVGVRSADSHGVFDLATLQAMNPEADILVGPHVWLGNGSSLLKGIEIGMGTIVGAGAIVTADLGPYSLCVGTPARVLRRGVSWTRNAVATEAEKQQILAAFERWGGVPPAA